MITFIYLLLSITPADTLQTLGLLLTWQQDPTSTITIDWHTPAHTPVPTVQYRAAGSEAWVPLFEQAGIEFVFENHDHAYKRTKPILGNEVDANGIVFIGDGAWGVGTRHARAALHHHHNSGKDEALPDGERGG